MKLDILMQRPDFVEKLSAVQSLDEAMKLFEQEGVQITREELEEYVQPKDQELAEEHLENVAGGSALIGSAVASLLKKLLGPSHGGGGHAF